MYGTDISGMGWLCGVWDRYDGYESMGQRCMSGMRICDGYEWYERDMSGMGEIRVVWERYECKAVGLGEASASLLSQLPKLILEL